jgi:hypothetical protein
VVNYRNIQIHGLLGWLLRSAADFIAFKDIESWSRAANQWTEEIGDQEDCPFCREPTPTPHPAEKVGYISY